MHPDAIKLATEFARGLADFNQAKLRLEYVVQSLQAKGLTPTQEGFPDALGIEGGTIGGNASTLNAADYAQALVGLSGMVGFIQTPVDEDGPSVESALLRFAAA